MVNEDISENQLHLSMPHSSGLEQCVHASLKQNRKQTTRYKDQSWTFLWPLDSKVN